MNDIARRDIPMPGGRTQNQYRSNPLVIATPELVNSFSIRPHVMRVGSNKPRKLSEASATMAPGTEVASAR